MKTYLIDDDAIGAYLTENLLKAEGVAVPIYTFQSAEKALDDLIARPKETLPKVVFLDLNMPLMNGWQFLEALEPYQNKLRDSCHIYILTSSLALADLEKSRHYELVSGLIHKPLDRGEIRAIYAQLLDGAA